MTKTKKIIISIIMLVTVVATTVAPTFASTVFDEGNTITFRGHFVLGTSYKVNDIVMYNGTLYKCLIGNAIVDPNSTQFWTPYLNTNYDNSNECESAYNEGLKDGYNEGYEVGAMDGAIEGYENGRFDGYESGKADGYNEGNTDGFQEGYEFGVEIGYEEGYESGKFDGYESGKADGYNEGNTDGFQDGYEFGVDMGYDLGYNEGYQCGVNEGFANGKDYGYDKGYIDGHNDGVNSVTPENSIGHFLGATINFYEGGGKRPSNKYLVWTETVTDVCDFSKIINFTESLSSIPSISEEFEEEWVIEIIFPSSVDFIQYPLLFRDTTTQSKMIDYSKFMTIKFMDTHDEVALEGNVVFREGSYTAYSPGKDLVNDSPIDVVRIYINKRQYLSYAQKEVVGESGTNFLYLCNEVRTVALHSDKLLASYYNLGYKQGEKDNYTYAYDDGYAYGYAVGYDAGMVGGDGFKGLFDGIASVPVTVLSSLLGFEVFGINIMATLCGLLAILLIVWVIKRFI